MNNNLPTKISNQCNEILDINNDENALWESGLAELKATIDALANKNQFIIFGICSHFFNQQTIDQANESTTLDIIKSIESTLSIEKYRKIMEGKIVRFYNTYTNTIDFYEKEFILQRRSYLIGATNVFTHIERNIGIIESDFQSIHAKFCMLSPTENQQGRYEWKGYTRKYAKENLIGISPNYFFSENTPRHIIDYLKDEIEIAGANLVTIIYLSLKSLTTTQAPSNTEVGIEFENNLLEILAAEFPQATIERTPTTGDQGADLLIKIESLRIAIQAKRYTGVVGNAAIQEVYAAQKFYDADFSMVVTNSRYTDPAKTLAEKLNVYLATDKDFIRIIRYMMA